MVAEYGDPFDDGDDASELLEAFDQFIYRNGRDPLLIIRVCQELQRRIGDAVHRAVLGARETGHPWGDIGDALGVTHQAARQRFGYVDQELIDWDNLPPRITSDSRYIGYPVTVTCLRCGKPFRSNPGDTAEISANVIPGHERRAHPDDESTSRASIAVAKEHIRRGLEGVIDGRWRLEVER